VTDNLDERQGRSPAFWISVAVGVVAAVLLLIALSAGFGRDPRQPGNLANEGAKIDMTMELPLLDGSGTLAFSELEGKVVVINFWASYCIPCRAEHAALTSAFETYRDRNVQFVGVVYHDKPASARDFLDNLGWGEGYLYVEDPGARVTVDFGVWGVPETYFVDETGAIVDKHYGEITSADLSEMLDAILAGGATG